MIIKHLNRRCLLPQLTQTLRRNQSTNQPSSTHYDIVVAGGGMVGTTLACTLGKNSNLSEKKILLLEGSKQKEWKLPEEYTNRVSALSPATHELLKSIGAWQHIAEARFGTVKRMQVWDGVSEAGLSFDRSDVSQSVAHIVENDLLIDSVNKAMVELGNVDVVYEAKIRDCVGPNEEDHVTVCMENGTKFTCDLLLGCDGANSLVRKSMGFHSISDDYKHMGIVVTLKVTEDGDNDVAWQRQLPESAFLAMLPLTQGLSSMVWTVKTEEAKRLVQLPEDQFVDAINDALWKKHPKSGLIDQTKEVFDNFIRFCNLPSSTMTQCPPKVLGVDLKSRAMFPLGWAHSTNYVSKGVALVGDAAHRIHPLAGQGVNLGFGDVICLNDVVERASYAGSDLGSLLYLKEYETERQRHVVPMMLVVHAMFQLYGTQFTPLVLLRSLGIQTTQALSPLKKLLISRASGLRYWEA